MCAVLWYWPLRSAKAKATSVIWILRRLWNWAAHNWLATGRQWQADRHGSRQWSKHAGTQEETQTGIWRIMIQMRQISKLIRLVSWVDVTHSKLTRSFCFGKFAASTLVVGLHVRHINAACVFVCVFVLSTTVGFPHLFRFTSISLIPKNKNSISEQKVWTGSDLKSLHNTESQRAAKSDCTHTRTWNRHTL